jgi:hypothetical protein
MKITDIVTEAANPAQQAAIAISMKKAGKKPKTVDEDLTRRGFLRGLGAAVAGAAGSALAGSGDPGFIRQVQDQHYSMIEKNPRYAKEHQALQLPVARGIVGSSAETNKRWAEKTAELLEKYGVKVNEGVAEGHPSDNDMGATTGGTKMTLNQWKQMWMKKMPNADFAALFRSPPNMQGSAIAYFDGWMNNPDARWDPEKGVAEGDDDHIWGSQGRFAGDTHVNVGDVAMKMIQVGDIVKYFGQKAEVVAMSKDRKRARITRGGITQDVNTSDLTQLGQGMAEDTELAEEFDLIESIVEMIAQHNGVDAEVVWEDLESLTEDELYVFAVTSEPIMESQGVAEATGDEKFDTMMGQMQREPTIPDPQMPPTDVKDLYQWAVKNNKPYHKIFAEWANREGYKSVAPALQKAGNLDSDALDYWTPRVWEIYWGEVRGIDSEMPPEWAKKRIPDELRDYLDTVFDAYDRIVFDWPTEYRQIGQQGMAEDWQKANKRDKTDGMSQKAVNAYRRENPGSKLKTAVTTKPSKLKKGGKASKRRKSYCSRSRGQMKMHSISCAKTPDKAICKARRRWNC